MRRAISLILAAAAFAAAPAIDAAAQQDYPNRPIRVIAGSGPGGISDIFIRAVGEELAKRHGITLVVENRAGGQFNIATRACAEAAPDGYTICIVPNEPITYNKHLFRNLGYDPETGVAPITQLFFMTQALAINSKLNVKSIPELVAYGKANPKTLNYTAPAAAHNLYLENLNRQHGLDMVRVPFRSGGESVNGVLSGVTPITFLGIGNFMPHIRAGTINGLVIDGDKRTPLLPDVPGIIELGYKEPLTRSYFGLYAPAGMAKEQMVKFADAVRAVGNDAAFRARHMIERGLEPVFNSPDAFAEFLKTDRITAKKVIDAAGLQPQ
jgi:tripartite-type tricarboxylate transporter receptor subunit TctC